MRIFRVTRAPAGPDPVDRKGRDLPIPRRPPPDTPDGEHPRVGLMIRRKRETPRSRRSRRSAQSGPPKAMVLFSAWRAALEAGRFDDAMSALDGLRQLSQRPDRA
jgi:hypothetical protein